MTSATDTTQCGVVEIEYGLERQWPGNGANRDDLSGGLRMGLAHNLDLHWSSGAATLILRLFPEYARGQSLGFAFSSNPENGDRGWPGSPGAQTTPAKVHSSSADESL